MLAGSAAASRTRDVQGGLVGGAGGGQVPGRDRHVPNFDVADGQVALPVGVGRVGGGAGLDLAVDGVQQPGRRPQVPGLQQGIEFLFGDHDPDPLGRRDQRADLGQVGDHGQRPAQHPGGLAGNVGNVVVAAQGGQVPGDIHQVLVGAALLVEPARPHRQRPLMLAAEISTGVAGDQLSGPWVHDDVIPGPEQGQVRQPGHIRRQHPPSDPCRGPAARLRSRGQGERQVIQGHRGAADRDLPQRRLLARGQQPGQLIQQDVRAAHRQRLLHRGIDRLLLSQVQALPPGQVPQPGLDVAEAGAAAAQQRVGELDQPRVPADHPGQHPPPVGVQVSQGRQPQEQPPQLRRRQCRDRDLGQEPVRARQRVPAGHQQPPRSRPHPPAP